MPKDIKCSECGYFSVNFTIENTDVILKEQARYLNDRKRRSVEQILNKIVKEWKEK